VKISPDISYEDFLVLVDKYHQSIKTNRYGQTYFLVLSSAKPQLAELLRGSLHDPFHKDIISDQTHQFVKSKWSTNG
jgi:hypothetical protein